VTDYKDNNREKRKKNQHKRTITTKLDKAVKAEEKIRGELADHDRTQ